MKSKFIAIEFAGQEALCLKDFVWIRCLYGGDPHLLNHF